MLKNELDKLLRRRPIPSEKVIQRMAKAAYIADPDELPAIVEIASMNDSPLDSIISVPALALLPAWGTSGILELVNVAIEGPHESYALGILAIVANNNIPKSENLVFLNQTWDKLENYSLEPDISSFAKKELRALMLESLTEDLSRRKLVWSLSALSINPNSSEVFEYIFDLLIDSRLILNQTILSQFELILDSGPDREEDLHQFLLSNPILLDPFITELRNKHELGDDFITDFVIRRINDEYVLVEIENSTDQLFRKDGSFTSSLSQAIGQVRDFQIWINDNLTYARSKLPNIRRPEGLVVIGRRKDLTPDMETRLNEENHSRRGHIKIMTYDDLFLQAQSVYKNILEKPLVLWSRDQKSI